MPEEKAFSPAPVMTAARLRLCVLAEKLGDSERTYLRPDTP